MRHSAACACSRPMRRPASPPPRRCSTRTIPPHCRRWTAPWRTETDAGVKRRMEQARAAALLFADGHAARPIGWPPIAVLARARRYRQPQPAWHRCRARRRRWPPPPRPRSPAIDRNLQLWSILQSVYYGLSLGSVLLLAAAGLAITFGVMGVINMAHGEMVMIGAYVTFMVQQVIRDVRAWPVRRQPADRRAAGVHRRRADRHRHRAHADPLAVRPAAGDAAGDLGIVAGAAAGGALDLRSPTIATSARPDWMSGADRTRRPDDHL